MKVSIGNGGFVIFLFSSVIVFFLMNVMANAETNVCESIKDKIFTENSIEIDFDELMYCANEGDDYLKSYAQGILFLGEEDVSPKNLEFIRHPVLNDGPSLLKSYFINASRFKDKKSQEYAISLLTESARLRNPYAGYILSIRYMYRNGDLADSISHFSYSYGYRFGILLSSFRNVVINSCDVINDSIVDLANKDFFKDPHFSKFLYLYQNEGCDLNKIKRENFNFFYLPIDDYIEEGFLHLEGYNRDVAQWVSEFGEAIPDSPIMFCSKDDVTCIRFSFYDDFYCRAALSIGDNNVYSSKEYKKCRSIFLEQRG